VIYEWDAEKARANWRKHSVSFDEATTVFEDTLGRIVSDPRHSIEEDRLRVAGAFVAESLACRYVHRTGESGSNY